METIALVAFGAFLTMVAIAFVVLVHLNFQEVLYHAMNSYSQSIHAHDDASVRIADHRRLDNERFVMLMHYVEVMAKANSELSQFVLAHKAMASPPHVNPTTICRPPQSVSAAPVAQKNADIGA